MPDPYWEKVRQDAEKARAERMRYAIPTADKEQGERGRAGKRLWQCADCKHEQMEHWIKLNRATRLRCSQCGSLRYEMKTKEAREDASELRGVREQFRKTPRGSGHGKFIIGKDEKS
jgi:DNA-directed RNA polymerase subunit RPC12/RpoP